jgi:recombinational DNA repair protein RecR
MPKKKNKVIINDIENKEQTHVENVTNVILSVSEKYNICKECENLTPKTKVCIKIDCAKCKGNVIQWINEDNSVCPIEKW